MVRNWMKWALAASLAVNLLILGAVGGAMLGDGPRDRDGRDGDRTEGGPPEIRTIMSGLDRDARARLIATLRSDGALRADRDRMDAAHAQMVAALRADPFDPQVFAAALTSRQLLQVEVATRGADALGAALAELSPEERAALADRMERRKRR